jgi:hypothetical protein
MQVVQPLQFELSDNEILRRGLTDTVVRVDVRAVTVSSVDDTLRERCDTQGPPRHPAAGRLLPEPAGDGARLQSQVQASPGRTATANSWCRQG